MNFKDFSVNLKKNFLLTSPTPHPSSRFCAENFIKNNKY